MALVAVVDDDRLVRDELRARLGEVGYTVVTAPSGLRLLSTLHVDRPDVILLDVMMSWIDGVELCKAIKANQSLQGIPVVFISGKTGAADVQRGLDAGAVAYLPKPLDMDSLIETVRTIVGPP